ncbi:uncharacterized protein LOC102710527 [Oryza brachyantha]|uniref:uncharacterized protein LOC102710527 n=1 Tax=Oryza brachyantha TaxID=4533 RepID=UPI000776570D|nr:uncharacterized protein LOC102710527 [Oryza brachyantha]
MVKIDCRSVRRRRCIDRANNHRPRLLFRTKSGPLIRQEGDVSEGTMSGFDFDKLPEDILCHIHSLVPLQEAARMACVSHRFLRSWRCFPNLTFNLHTLSLDVFEGETYKNKMVDRIDKIIQNHSGLGVKTLKLDVSTCFQLITVDQINNWLHAIIKPGMLEIALMFPLRSKRVFDLSCSLLSCAASSLQSISFFYVGFHPTLSSGCFSSLRSVCFRYVDITTEELGCLLSSTFSLQKLEINSCDQLTFLNIPSHLQHLTILNVSWCTNLQRIEIYAPKLTTFDFRGPPMKIITGDSSHLKDVTLHGALFSGMIQYARTELHSFACNLQTLTLASVKEDFNTPMLPEKFLHLRNLHIYFESIGFQSYDYFSLASFIEACPALENFYVWAGEYDHVWKDPALEVSDADSLQIRRIPGFHHSNLKIASVNRFFPSKSLIELIYLIIENASSLQWLKLDTAYRFDFSGMCKRMCKEDVSQALKAVEVAKRYIGCKVPSTVEFNILEPCKRCHIPKLYEL